MITKESASSQYFDCSPKFLENFSNISDPFNIPNTISGFISRKPNWCYGSLLITHVNNQELFNPIFIKATPKIPYPFYTVPENGDRIYSFWQDIIKAEAYEKLDGTNILAFIYYDNQNNFYLSYKLRLQPFLKVNIYNDFIALWKIVLEKEDNYLDKIMKQFLLLHKNRSTLPNLLPAFELYGTLNQHLVKYEKEIDFHLLYMVDQVGRDISTIPPSQIELESPLYSLCSLPIILNPLSLQQDYENLRNQAQAQNTLFKIENPATEQFSTEGKVVYTESSIFGWTPWKCKPEDIEKIHWSRSKRLTKEQIYTTIRNYMEELSTIEDFNEITLQEILTEDFDLEFVENSNVQISKIKDVLLKEAYETRTILTLFEDISSEIRQTKDKRFIMPAIASLISSHQKKSMSFAFNVLKRYGHIIEA